jgi:hypothetical protein
VGRKTSSAQTRARGLCPPAPVVTPEPTQMARGHPQSLGWVHTQIKEHCPQLSEQEPRLSPSGLLAPYLVRF